MKIRNFLISKNLTSIEGITENFRKKNKQLKHFIQQDNIKEVLQFIKKIDKKLYHDCKIILKNIGKIRNSMIKNVKNNKGYKNDYHNIKFDCRTNLICFTNHYFNIVSYSLYCPIKLDM